MKSLGYRFRITINIDTGVAGTTVGRTDCGKVYGPGVCGESHGPQTLQWVKVDKRMRRDRGELTAVERRACSGTQGLQWSEECISLDRGS